MPSWPWWRQKKLVGNRMARFCRAMELCQVEVGVRYWLSIVFIWPKGYLIKQTPWGLQTNSSLVAFTAICKKKKAIRKCGEQKERIGLCWVSNSVIRSSPYVLLMYCSSGIVGAEVHFHECTVVEIQSITHDTNLYRVRPPQGMHFKVPVGHHVVLKVNVEGKAAWLIGTSRSIICWTQ